MAKTSGKIQRENAAVQTSNSVELDKTAKTLPRREKNSASRGDLYNEYYNAYMNQFMASANDEGLSK